MKSIAFFGVVMFQLIACGSIKTETMIVYTDQNNNSFTLSRSEIIYKAIKPFESSSGTYSGGTDKQTKISSSDFDILKNLSFEMIKDETYHANKREMMTSVIMIQSKGENKRVVLYPSPQRTLFEKALRKTTGLD
jgi:hypothetical protein